MEKEQIVYVLIDTNGGSPEVFATEQAAIDVIRGRYPHAMSLSKCNKTRWETNQPGMEIVYIYHRKVRKV